MAKSVIKKHKFLIFKILELLLPSKSILLNRAPTLHRLGIQAFDPIIVPGKAIQLHPLVCTGFNADFDGDQMAVHLPVSSVAQLEAKRLLRASYNFLSPANGSPILKPSQDMIIGCYYLTIQNEKSNHLSFGNYFSSFNETTVAYYQKKLSLHTPIWVKVQFLNFDKNYFLKNSKFFKILNKKNTIYWINKKFQISFSKKNNQIISQYIRTTPGRILFNELLEKNLKIKTNFLKKENHQVITEIFENTMKKKI
jgi:DNA-directed RNA polymerase subunit beta'